MMVATGGEARGGGRGRRRARGLRPFLWWQSGARGARGTTAPGADGEDLGLRLRPRPEKAINTFKMSLRCLKQYMRITPNKAALFAAFAASMFLAPFAVSLFFLPRFSLGDTLFSIFS